MIRHWASSGLPTGSRDKVLNKKDAGLLNNKRLGVALMLGLLTLPLGIAWPYAVSDAQAQDAVPMNGLKLTDSKDPVSIDAGKLEMRDKDGVAIFTGNVAVKQGDIMLRAGRMQVYYAKSGAGAGAGAADKPKGGIGGLSGAGLGAGGIEKLEVDGKVYLKSGTQVATGDAGVYDAKTQTMVLTGKKVVLSDGDNIATGCKLTANTQTGKAFLESCKGQTGRVSIILSPKSE